MSPVFQPLGLLAAALLLTSCVQEGHTPICGNGGAGSEESEGCFTPIGGSCLSEAEFKGDRPVEREDGDRTVTVEDDWISYQEVRPQCDFACMSEDEFREGRSDERRNESGRWVSLDEDWEGYMTERRPDCFE